MIDFFFFLLKADLPSPVVDLHVLMRTLDRIECMRKKLFVICQQSENDRGSGLMDEANQRYTTQQQTRADERSKTSQKDPLNECYVMVNFLKWC